MLWNKGGLRIKLGSTWISPQTSLFSVIFVKIAMGSSFDVAKIYYCAVFGLKCELCLTKMKYFPSVVWAVLSWSLLYPLFFFLHLQGKISTDYKIMLHLTFHILITTYEVYFVCIFFVVLNDVFKLKWVCGLTQLNYCSDNVNNTWNDRLLEGSFCWQKLVLNVQ